MKSTPKRRIVWLEWRTLSPKWHVLFCDLCGFSGASSSTSCCWLVQYSCWYPEFPTLTGVLISQFLSLSNKWSNIYVKFNPVFIYFSRAIVSTTGITFVAQFMGKVCIWYIPTYWTHSPLVVAASMKQITLKYASLKNIWNSTLRGSSNADLHIPDSKLWILRSFGLSVCKGLEMLRWENKHEKRGFTLVCVRFYYESLLVSAWLLCPHAPPLAFPDWNITEQPPTGSRQIPWGLLVVWYS